MKEAPTTIITLGGKAKEVFKLFALLCKVQGNKRICEVRRI